MQDPEHEDDKVGLSDGAWRVAAAWEVVFAVADQAVFESLADLLGAWRRFGEGAGVADAPNPLVDLSFLRDCYERDLGPRLLEDSDLREAVLLLDQSLEGAPVSEELAGLAGVDALTAFERRVLGRMHGVAAVALDWLDRGGADPADITPDHVVAIVSVVSSDDDGWSFVGSSDRTLPPVAVSPSGLAGAARWVGGVMLMSLLLGGGLVALARSLVTAGPGTPSSGVIPFSPGNPVGPMRTVDTPEEYLMHMRALGQRMDRQARAEAVRKGEDPNAVVPSPYTNMDSRTAEIYRKVLKLRVPREPSPPQ